MVRLKLLMVVGVVAAIASSAWSKTTVMTAEWRMSESESRATARELVLEKMRLQAAQEAGKVVQSSASLRDGQLSEEVKLIGVSLVKIEVLSEKMTVDQDTSTLTVTARVTVDEEELKRRAEALRTDTKKARVMRDLVEENASLRMQLDALNRGVRQEPGSGATETASAAALWARLRGVKERAGVVFGPGYVTEMQSMEEEDWERIQTTLDRLIVEPMAKSAVRVSLIGVSKSEKGYLARVRVDWTNGLDKVWSSLREMHTDAHLASVGGSRLVAVDVRRESLRGRDVQSAKREFDYLIGSEVGIEVRLGGQTRYIPVMFARQFGFAAKESCLMPEQEGDRRAKETLCLVENTGTGHEVIGGKNVGNPLTFEITARQAEERLELLAFIVTKKPDGRTTRVPAR